jgi:GNAT superfamily N-acetyltransferase
MASEAGHHEPVATRPASVADAPAIAGLLEELGYPTDSASAAARIAGFADDSGSTVVIAARAGVVCGLATVHLIPLFHRDGALARITSFVVERSAQRSGVGSALLAACEAYARSHGAGRIEVTSGDRRAEAHAFYEARGFEREGLRMTRWLVEQRDRP